MRRAGLWLLVVTGCLAPLGAETPALTALVVGINDYRDRLIPDLSFARPDAEVMAQFLGEQPGGPHTIRLQTERSAAEAQPTLAGLRRSLAEIAAQLQPDDTFVFYYAGHGVNLDNEDYLVPQDAVLGSADRVRESCLPVAEVVGLLSEVPARQVLFILDACRDTGQTDRTVFGTALRIASGGGEQANQVRATLSAARPGQQALEWPKVGHGLFTWFLLEGWRGPAAEPDGSITVDGLARYTQRQVKEWTEEQFRGRRSQLPWLLKDGVAPLVLGQGHDARTITVDFDQVPLRDALTEVTRQAGYDLLVTPGVTLDSPVTVRLNQRPVAAALTALLAPVGLSGSVESQILVVKPGSAGRVPAPGPPIAPGPPVAAGPPTAARRPTGADGMPLVLVPGGSFTRGSDRDDLAAVLTLPVDGPPLQEWMFWNELSEQPITVDSYWLDEHEVTNAQFRQFVEAGGYGDEQYWSESGWRWAQASGVTGPAGWSAGRPADTLPVVGVSYWEAEAYARWAGRRLPTEAEWEYAGQGGAGRQWDFGDTFEPHRASLGLPGPRAVKSHPANPYGLYDLTGNAAEWCADIFDPDFYRWGETLNPICVTNLRVDLEEPRRVVRGGGYEADAVTSRVRTRGSSSPEERQPDRGFRCAADLSSQRSES